MEFEMPKEGTASIIKVIGVGGGGGNAVNYMYELGIHGVDYVICNTDRQALDASAVPTKIQLGPTLTEGRGAGAIPEIGKRAVEESIEGIRDFLSDNTKMVFVTAGMGGGTGTGAAPVIAKLAKEMGILTVGIVTVPFNFEGRKRRQQAAAGLEEMRKSVDTLLVINNERLREIHGNLTLSNAFAQADGIVSSAAKGIAEVISLTGAINVDFNDVTTVMKDSGAAILGSGQSTGENRAIEAVQQALTSPLLNDDDIAGATYVLLNITYGKELEASMDEIADITDYIQDEAGSTADVIWGHGFDESLGDAICVTVIATGFNSSPVTGFEKAPERNVTSLVVEQSKPLVENTAQTSAEPQPFLKTSPVEEEITANQFSYKPAQNHYVEPKEEEVTPEFTWVNEELANNEPNALTEQNSDNTEDFLKPEVVKFDLLGEDPEGDHRDLFGSAEERMRLTEERLARIASYTSKLKKPEGLNELEKVPAYKRKSIELDDVPHSSESDASRFGLFADNEGNTGLKSDNSFLHDNVD
jgi:cell division protein FtsZ